MALPAALQELAGQLPTLGLALALLAALLAVGTALGRLLGTHQWGIPEALLAGGLGLLLAPGGALPWIPPAVIDLWDQLPLVLLTLVFASLLLGKPLPAVGGLWRPLSAQMLLALILAFGQYLVAGLAVLLLLQPLLGAPSVMACLIEVAYEGGHGSAAAMGPTYARLGLESGEALGLALATVGLLASTVVGGLLVLLGRRRGWTLVVPPTTPEESGNGSAPTAIATSGSTPTAPTPAPGLANPGLPDGPSVDAGDPADPTESADATGATEAASATEAAAVAEAAHAADAVGSAFSGSVARPTPTLIAVNLALTGTAVLIGVVMLEGLRLLAARQGGLLAMVVEVLPVFPLALLGSLLVRLALERTQRTDLVLPRLQGRIGTLSADLLITAATACLDLSLLVRDWLPLSVLAGVGLVWNLAVILLLAPRILPASWFERGLIEFGQATGVAASGLLLLTMVDPEDRNGTLTPFSIKQLLLQPFLAGGVVTVVAPLAVDGWGLPAWTGFCLGLVLLWSALGLWLARGAGAG
ncbi:MAG: sodium:solute symporter [Cyanobium sp.]